MMTMMVMTTMIMMKRRSIIMTTIKMTLNLSLIKSRNLELLLQSFLVTERDYQDSVRNFTPYTRPITTNVNNNRNNFSTASS